MSKIDDLQAELESFLGNRPKYFQDPKYHRFQGYTHLVTVKINSSAELVHWCNDHCQGNYSLDAVNIQGYRFSFVNSQDAMLFKLTWGGQ